MPKGATNTQIVNKKYAKNNKAADPDAKRVPVRAKSSIGRSTQDSRKKRQFTGRAKMRHNKANREKDAQSLMYVDQLKKLKDKTKINDEVKEKLAEAIR